MSRVKVLVLDLSGPEPLRFGLGTSFWTELGPCVAFALLFLFISHNHTSHQPQKKKVIDVTASTGCRMVKCMYMTFSASKI